MLSIRTYVQLRNILGRNIMLLVLLVQYFASRVFFLLKIVTQSVTQSVERWLLRWRENLGRKDGGTWGEAKASNQLCRLVIKRRQRRRKNNRNHKEKEGAASILHGFISKCYWKSESTFCNNWWCYWLYWETVDVLACVCLFVYLFVSLMLLWF